MNTFIQTINIYDYERFRDRVRERCNVSRSTWSNWTKGGPVSAKYKAVIDEVALDMFGRTVFGKGGAK